MRIAAQILTVSASVILTFFPLREATAQENAAAIVEEIRGAVFWRRKASAKQEKLDPKTQTARRLYPGEQVRVTRGSVLRLQLGRESILVPAAVWFTIPQVVLSRSDPFRWMLEGYADDSGIERGSPLEVFSPAHHGASLPQPFVIRWIPTPAGCEFSLVIQDVGGNKVWRQGHVDGSSGRLASRDVELALLVYRAKFGQGPLELSIFDSCGSEPRVSFSLLSISSERSLKQDLAFWGKRTGRLINHLGRASVYGRYRMFSHAADEYEAALRGAPESLHLLVRAIQANRSTGNFTRADELEKRLPAGTAIP